MRKRLVQTLITSIVVSSLFVTPVLATPQDKVNELEKKKSETEAKAASVNSELTALLLDYEALQEDMANQEVKITEATENLEKAQAEEQKQYEDMKLRIKYMYEEGDSSFVETLVTAESYSDLVSKSEYVQKVHDYDREKLKEYVETKEEVQELKTELESQQADMESMAEEMNNQQANLQATLNQMQSEIADFDSQLTVAKEEAAAELARLQAEAEAAAKAAQEAANKPNNGQASNTGNANKPGNGTNTPSKPSNGNNNNNGDSNTTTGKPSNASLGQQIANRGCNYIGNPYVLGGNSLTNGIDCSGFVQQIHAQFGISTPRTSSAIRTSGKAVSYSDMLPGDVVCYSGHVAIYIGNNTVVHASNSAPYPKGGIKTTSPANYRTVLAVRRYW